MNKDQIKQTLQTKGWEEIEQMIREEQQKIRDTMDIKIDEMTTEQIAVKVEAKNQAFKAIGRLLTRLHNIDSQKNNQRTPLI